MDISVIIVNYNVKYFLEQAILSVQKSGQGLSFEIIVVDNHSSDGSTEMVKNNFPEVRLIENSDNPGFSKANNQGLGIARGKYILFLNPDTLVSDDTLGKCFHYMEAHTTFGALGVKMMDGAGRFLPESKRGVPYPIVAFFKMLGLNKLFPSSEYFNRYYMGHIHEDETAPIEVLTGAFFWVRKSILDDIGGFDESFFMYGEDIDLSYRVLQSGNQIVYFPQTRIIHYKGESTKKGSLNYVKHFYQAMIIFSDKHFRNGYSIIIRLLMLSGVYFGAFLASLKRIISSVIFPILDICILLLVILVFKQFWAAFYYDDPGYYTQRFYFFNIPVYLGVWMSVLWFGGVYDKPYKLDRLVSAMFLGLLINGLIYGLLDNPYRPSRMIMLIAFVIGSSLMVLSRTIIFYIQYKDSLWSSKRKKRILVVAQGAEAARIKKFTSSLTSKADVVGYVSKNRDGELAYLGQANDLQDIVRAFHINEIVFSSEENSASEVMQMMKLLGPNILYKMSSATGGIIGSKHKNTSGEIYTTDLIYQLALPEYKRLKRLSDILLALFLVLIMPLWMFKKIIRGEIITNMFPVIIGQKTWISYRGDKADRFGLPDLKEGVWEVGLNELNYLPEQSFAINRRYAEKYHPALDISQVWYHVFQQ